MEQNPSLHAWHPTLKLMSACLRPLSTTCTFIIPTDAYVSLGFISTFICDDKPTFMMCTCTLLHPSCSFPLSSPTHTTHTCTHAHACTHMHIHTHTLYHMKLSSDPFRSCRTPTFFAVGTEGKVTSVEYVEVKLLLLSR